MADHPENPEAPPPTPLDSPEPAGPSPEAAELRPDEAEQAKAASRELARWLATPGGARTARALQRAGKLRLPPPALVLPAVAPGGAAADEQGAGGSPPRAPGRPSRAPRLPQPPQPSQPPQRSEPPPQPSQPLRAPRPISIWQPRGAGAELVFVRPDPLPLGDHFAARRELHPKRGPLPLRVCLFGESTAAGYLYAPHLTPAGVLESQLRAVAGEGAAEVVDLARTNETLASLVATLESAVQIQPDVVVVFAGNNWNLLETPEVSPYAPSVEARQRYAGAWRAAGAAGPAGPVALAAGRLREIAEAAFDRVALIARAIGVPVVLVVPEVSLAGWESRQPVLWLPGDGGPPPVARWYRLLAGARRHLERGAWPAAARTAQAMLDLDGGANPTSWRLLARARLGGGDEPAAAAAARAEVDAAAYPTLAFLGAPQATGLARDLLREAARRHGFACVDLPEVFAAHTGSALPGPRLFLDYCHLTAEGIEVAMAAVAAEVLRLAGVETSAADPVLPAAGAAGEAEAGAAPAAGTAAAPLAARAAAATTSAATAAIRAAAAAGELGWRELLRRLPRLRVAPHVEAVARLGAAVHGAHRLLPVGPKTPFLATWCDAALAASPGVESAMLDLIAARAAPLPAVLTPAQRRNLVSDFRLGLQHGWRWDHLDADLVEAIAASLERHGRQEAVAQADALLLAHRGVRPQGTDLLDPPYYLWEPLERFYPEVMTFDDQPRAATLRAPWPETTLCLVCDAERDAVLEITARLPLTLSPTPGEPFPPPREPCEQRLPPSPPGSSAPSGLSRTGAPRRRRGLLRLSVDGRPAGAVPLREVWSRPVVCVPRHLLRRGRNRLTLHWPMPSTRGDVALSAALARLDEGIAADLHPVFGELYSLVARPG
jgi:hypothetical protein